MLILMRRLGGTLIGIVGIVALLTGCSTGAAGTFTPAPTQMQTEVALPSPTPESTVEWLDAASLIIAPSATTPAELPHGPSWVTADGKLSCGIYDDSPAYDTSGNRTGTKVFYGCRIDQTASTFTYPDFDSPSKGKIGGCPSGFSAYAGDIPAPLCNSGQVFSSDTDHSNVLQPGQGVRFAGIECVASAVDAMDCTEPVTSHGFRASLSDYALF